MEFYEIFKLDEKIIEKTIIGDMDVVRQFDNDDFKNNVQIQEKSFQ